MEHCYAAVLHNIEWTMLAERVSHLYLNFYSAEASAVQIKRFKKKASAP